MRMISSAVALAIIASRRPRWPHPSPWTSCRLRLLRRQSTSPLIAVGSRVRVPRYQIGTVLSVAGDQVTIAFPENTTRTFMAEFVAPA